MTSGHRRPMTFLVVPASETCVWADYEKCFTKTFRYGRTSEARGRPLTDLEESMLWGELVSLRYVSAACIEKFKNKSIAMRQHLETFCHVNALDHSSVVWRNDLAQLVLGRIQSAEKTIAKSIGLIHITSVLSTGTYSKMRQFLVLDTSSTSPRQVILLTLRFLGFVPIDRDMQEQDLIAFIRAQKYAELDANIMECNMPGKVDCLYRLLTSDSYMGVRWVRRNRQA